jgi:deoxyribodipyrimidine photo-lyase
MDFGQKRFEKLPFPYYNDVRNDLDKDGTSRLSPYLRFGVFSIRQLYNKVHTNYESFPEKGTHEESYISELAWREFWWQILYNFPNTKEEEFQEKRRNIEWSRDQELFEKWCE